MSSNDQENAGNAKKEDTPQLPRQFYGQAEYKSEGGAFSALLMRRKVQMPQDCKALCKPIESYKLSADRMHKALMFLLVENVVLSSKIGVLDVPENIEMDRPYKNIMEYLGNFEKCLKKGRKGTYPSFDPSIKAFKNMNIETEKYVKKQLQTLRSLTIFIGYDYWEYVRLRRIYWDSLENYDNALTLQSKERTPEAEAATLAAQTWRNDQKNKMCEYIKKLNAEKLPKNAECVVKFAEEAMQYHTKMEEILKDMNATPADSSVIKINK